MVIIAIMKTNSRAKQEESGHHRRHEDQTKSKLVLTVPMKKAHPKIHAPHKTPQKKHELTK